VRLHSKQFPVKYFDLTLFQTGTSRMSRKMPQKREKTAQKGQKSANTADFGPFFGHFRLEPQLAAPCAAPRTSRAPRARRLAHSPRAKVVGRIPVSLTLTGRIETVFIWSAAA
jgi:hypothetical protein